MEYFTSVIYTQSTLTPIEFLELRFFAITLTSIFFLINVLTILTNRKVTTIDLLTAGAIGLYTYGWINGLATAESKSLITAAAALIYSVAGYAAYTRTSLKQPAYLYTAIAVILLAVASAFEFKGPVLVIAFSIQAIILPIIGIRLLGTEIGKYILLYFILPVSLSFAAIISPQWNSCHTYETTRYNFTDDVPFVPMESCSNTILHNAFFALTIITLALLTSGLYFYYSKTPRDRDLHNASVTLIVIGGIYTLIWIWKVFHAGIQLEYVARMATLVAYTAIGLFTYITGEIQKRKILHKFGLFTLIFVLIRLLIFEIWGMELTGKIITFLLIGALLAGSVLLRKQPAKHL